MAPTIGRIVHYQAYGTSDGKYPSAPRAAVVTEVHEGEVIGLAILNPTGMFFTRDVQHATGDTPAAGCWNWPPKVG
jgi:hypothetical protein